MTDVFGLAGIFVAGIIAGAINSVAGGGTLISFPSLVAFGESQIVSNATNTAALWPGSLSSAIGYRKDTPLQSGLLATLLIPSFVGGILGAWILVVTPPGIFNIVVPFLVLFATLLFAFRDHITRRFRRNNSSEEEDLSVGSRVWGFFFQLFVATYGGYFGAGIGILMLGSLSIMGLRDIHKMNAIKTPLAAIINCTAFVLFAVKGLVAWDLALILGLGAILGGYVGARSAKRVNPRVLQTFVVVIGLIVSAWLLFKVIH
ncbi:MAG TPA: sulfite exporter TauE/SafE family protein [Methylomirabilota bacterium]|nr:sulfite exporter TauE/SafE family protein [Methylomirabilota bacterium]